MVLNVIYLCLRVTFSSFVTGLFFASFRVDECATSLNSDTNMYRSFSGQGRRLVVRH
uniref:Uncharacterized protein n=1 Tax=Oryza brachyantha TaxID=4533 RepID=J3L2Q9_ORYBR